MKQLFQISEGGSVARLTGVGGRESRRQVYTDVFTASCQASYRTSTKRIYFAHIPNPCSAMRILQAIDSLHMALPTKGSTRLGNIPQRSVQRFRIAADQSLCLGFTAQPSELPLRQLPRSDNGFFDHRGMIVFAL